MAKISATGPEERSASVCGGRCRNRCRSRTIALLLLLASFLAHGILISWGNIYTTKPFQETYTPFDFVDQVIHVHKEHSDNEIHEATVNTNHQKLRASLPEQQQQQQQQLPHWRLATDCSSYSYDCFASAQIEHKYLPYPFSSALRKDIAAASKISENTSAKQQQQKRKRLREEWSVETLYEIPGDWIGSLDKEGPGDSKSSSTVADRNFLYPPEVPKDEYQKCMDLAVGQNKSTTEQLDALLSGEFPRILPESDTNMVAFTISDYGYVRDMLHDVFQMMDDIVGFSRKHFFLVAIDQRSAELACKYGYTVVLWKADKDSLKDAVANAKVILSLDLVKRGIDFFFTEMDVWWVRSPKPILFDFQRKHDVDDGNHKHKHLYFSGHQSNHDSPNIGVYAVRADGYTEEYFRVCLDVLNKKPETHDQYVMAEVHRLFEYTHNNESYEFGLQFKPDGPPEIPTIQHPFKAMYFSPHQVVADERPMMTDQTLAIHTLSNKPLQAPHGKIMVAKESGVYYGFHTKPLRAPIPLLDANANAAAAGYYDRSGENRRYLWLDTDLRSNFYSIVQKEHYHDYEIVEWTMAILIAIARRTNRILVLPQVFNSRMGVAGTYFAWTMMDYSNVTELVDFRETNFLSNPKAWRNGRNSESAEAEHWPFESVVSTALFRAEDDNNQDKISIYTQVSNRSSIVSKKSWTVSSVQNQQWLDAWIASLSTVPESESAEALLVNPDILMNSESILRFERLFLEFKKQQANNATIEIIDSPDADNDSRMGGRIDREVLEIYDMLGWCWGDAFLHSASRVSASDSCYGKGQARDYKTGT